MLAIKRLGGVIPEVNMENPLHTGNEAGKQGTSPKVQNCPNSGPTKRTDVLHNLKKKLM